MNDKTKTAPLDSNEKPENEDALVAEIKRLKHERNAIILAHVYQPDEIQAIADYSGDSFALSQKAAQTDADVIVFCGVRFMAETANILSPDKITLLPAANATCRMFDDTIVEQVKKAKAEHPNAKVVAYVNTPAAVKAMSDICCTSSNASAAAPSTASSPPLILKKPNSSTPEHPCSCTPNARRRSATWPTMWAAPRESSNMPSKATSRNSSSPQSAACSTS